MYNGERMLIGANKLNYYVKNYLQSSGNYSMEEIKSDLEEFKLDLEEYINDITSYNFVMPRSDSLTKEGILNDLQFNLNEVNNKLANIQGGRKRKYKSIKHKKNKKNKNKKCCKKRTIKRR